MTENRPETPSDRPERPNQDDPAPHAPKRPDAPATPAVPTQPSAGPGIPAAPMQPTQAAIPAPKQRGKPTPGKRYQPPKKSNKATIIGWSIAGGLVLVLAVVVIFMVLYPSGDSPTFTAREGALELKKPSTPISSFLASAPSQSGNAAVEYDQAIRLVKLNMESLGAAQAAQNSGGARYVPGPDVRQTLNQINDLLASGGKKSQMTYIGEYGHTDFRIRYIYEPAGDFQDLLGAAMILAVYHYGQEQYDQAIDVLNNIFLMGYHMMAERGRLDMVARGISVQRRALATMRDVLNKKGGAGEKLAAIDAYMKELENIDSFNKQKYKALRQGGGSGQPSPGDVFNVIENDQDRMWRVEATLILGIVKYTATDSRGNVRLTRTLLAEQLVSEDPLEAAAARAAQNLDDEGFNRLGTE